MKLVFLVTLLSLLLVSTLSTHLRKFQQNHDFLNLDSMNPLQIAGLMSGDWTSILPASIQPLARKLLGKEQQTGVSGFLNQAQNIIGGGGNSGGLLGGLGGLFGQAAQSKGSQSGLSSVFGNFAGALGGNGGSSNSGSSFNIPGISNLFGSSSSSTPSASSGISSALNLIGLGK